MPQGYGRIHGMLPWYPGRTPWWLPICPLMHSLGLLIVLIGVGLGVVLVENARGLRLLIRLPIRLLRQHLASRSVIFSSGVMIGIPSSAGVAHLQELPGHVHTDKLARGFVGQKLRVDVGGRCLGQRWRAEAPVWQEL